MADSAVSAQRPGSNSSNDSNHNNNSNPDVVVVVAPTQTPNPKSAQPQLAGLASAGLHATSPKSLKRGLSAAFDPPALTGAAALAEERQRAEHASEEAKRRSGPRGSQTPTPGKPAETSVNPAMASVNALRNGLQTSQPFSRPGAAPTAPMSATASLAPSATATTATVSSRPELPSITATATTAEPMSIDQPQTTSPASMSSTEGLGSKAASALNMRPDDAASNANKDGSGSSSGGSNNSNHRHNDPTVPSSSSTRHEDRHPGRVSAMTYPGPPQPEPDEDVNRRMSLPASTSAARSPGKKHKCPHCSTEFTRHHNLKSHLLTHSQEKPYACSTCNSRFRRLHDLKRHNKLHTGERPHICDRCGRKFARGDALARHNKGPGGCAGRRSSMDDYDGEGESGFGDGMDGIVYSDAPAPGESPADYDRRRSEPGRNRQRASTLQSDAPSSSFRQHSSTYPGSAAAAAAATVAQSRNQFAQPQPLPSPSHLAASSGPNYASQLTPNSASLAQSGMTESPKPLSPGQTDQRRLSAATEPVYSRGRSPSHPQQHYPYNRQGGRATPPVTLPPPGMQQSQQPHAPPQLPPLDRLAGGQSVKTSAAYAQPGGSNAGSASSAHQSSGSSLRDFVAPAGGQGSGGEAALYEQIKHLEAQNARLKEENAISERYYETKLARLQSDNSELRAQLSARSAPGRT